ncbi:MAG: hypothetical protein A3H27_04770 [Acidobacteria bacterium RIFCSPLOWO2_02_FULL_59_13]|nr:MAG: hypothetical protein A3H27_04770 [Acidobacteria bacterium RIFCSPLOWO2_02_FULL_59_13]
MAARLYNKTLEIGIHGAELKKPLAVSQANGSGLAAVYCGARTRARWVTHPLLVGASGMVWDGMSRKTSRGPSKALILPV